MSWITKTLSSSVGKKVLMALTGLFLCLFLTVHLIGNLQLFNHDGGYSFNKYAVFMTTFPVIKIISYVNYALILFHAFWGLFLAYQNRQARPTQYAVTNGSSTWSSRNMAILGTVLLVYLVTHMANFWWEYHNGNLPYTQYVENLNSGEIVGTRMPAEYTQKVKVIETFNEAAQTRTVVYKDLYAEVSEAFKNPLLVIFYILGMMAVSFHLIHGFQSAFQTMGFNQKKFTPAVKAVGIGVFGVLIPLGYAAMPIYFLMKHLMS